MDYSVEIILTNSLVSTDRIRFNNYVYLTKEKTKDDVLAPEI